MLPPRLNRRPTVPAVVPAVVLALTVATLAALAAPAEAGPGKPDLKPLAFQATQTSAPGATVRAEVVVSASQQVKKTAATLVLSTDTRRDAGDTVLNGSGVKTKIVTRRSRHTATVVLSGALPAATKAGTYSLLACVDASGRVAEKKEGNNCRAASTTLTVSGPAGPAGPRDTTPPAVPTIGALSPASPSSNPTPTVPLSGEPRSRVDVYRAAGCTGPVAISLTLPPSGSGAAPVAMTHNATTTITAKSVDAAGNASACSAAKTYVHDDIAPAPPVVGAASPFVGGVDTGATYKGTAEAGTVVRAHDSNTCSTLSVQTSAGSFASGVFVATGPLQSIGFTAVDGAGNSSTCVQPPRGGTYIRNTDGSVVETSTANGSTGTAQDITAKVNAFGNGTAVVLGIIDTTTDVDYYRIDVPFSGYSLTADVRPDEVNPCNATMDSVLNLYDASGTQIATNDDGPGTNGCSRFDGVTTDQHQPGNRDLVPGTYYLAIKSFTGKPAFAYSIALRLVRTAGFEQEGNGTVAFADTIVGPHGSMIGQISPTSDLDYYRYVATGSRVVIDVLRGQSLTAAQCTAGSAVLMDSKVTLLNAAGDTELGSNDDAAPGTDYCSHAVVTGLTTGTTYMIRVQRAAPAASGSASTFDYVLTIGP